MVGTGVCCSNLEEPKALMKMGLSTVLIGHVNFVLGALVHGVVLRHINLHTQARAMEYAISNVVALTSGLVGVVVGILAIVLSKNKKSRGLTWSLFTISLIAALMAAASAIGLFVSVVGAIIHGKQSLLTPCSYPDATGYSSVTNQCPFDPTRIYSTTLILWVPLIVTCVVQLVFSARCFAVCVSFLGLGCCPTRKKPRDHGRAINVVRPIEEAAPTCYVEPRESYIESVAHYSESSRRHNEPPRHASARLDRQPPPLPAPQQRHHLSYQHQSLPPSERRPLVYTHREWSGRHKPKTQAGSQHRPAEQHQLLQRGTMERSSFWI